MKNDAREFTAFNFALAFVTWFLLGFFLYVAFEAVRHLYEAGGVQMLLGSGMAPFIRLPKFPMRQVTLANGATINVPGFIAVPLDRIAYWEHQDPPQGINRSLTRLVTSDGQSHDINMFEDEVTMLVNQIAKVPYNHYDYSQHQEFRSKYREALKPRTSQNKPAIQRELFLAPFEDPRESTPVDTDRVGPPAAPCTMCDSPIEDGQTTMVFGNDRICFDCATKIAAEADSSEQNPEIRKAVQKIQEAFTKPATKTTRKRAAKTTSKEQTTA